jgi:hypothetical protein
MGQHARLIRTSPVDDELPPRGVRIVEVNGPGPGTIQFGINIIIVIVCIGKRRDHERIFQLACIKVEEAVIDFKALVELLKKHFRISRIGIRINNITGTLDNDP